MVSVVKVKPHDPAELLAQRAGDSTRWSLPPDFSYLVDADGEVIEPVLFYLRDKCAPFGYMRSKWSCGTYAAHLYEWMTILEEMGIPWDEVTSETIENYSAALGKHVSLHTGKVLEPTTRKQRTMTIVSFYQFAASRGYISMAPSVRRAPFSEPKPEETPPPLEKERLAAAVNRIIVPSKGHPSCIPEDHLRRIFDELGPAESAGPATGFQPSCRDRLVAESALYSGMRLMEVAALEKVAILSIVPSSEPNKPCALFLRETKGSRARTVFVPSRLISALHDYIDKERREVVRRAKERNPDYVEPPQLFLNGLGANSRDFGRPLTRENIMERFTNAMRATRIFTVSAAKNPSDGVWYLKFEPAYTFHNLRHTFAYTLYRAQYVAGHEAPWRVVKTLLGHARLSTTLDTYLAGVDVEEAQTSDAMVTLFHSWEENFRAAA